MEHNKSDVNVQTFIDQQDISTFQWIVLGLCLLAMLMDGYDTVAIGYIAPSLIQQWGVSKPALGPVLSAALVGFAIGPLFAGPLADRFGRKRVLIGAALAFGISSVIASFSGDLQMLTAMRFLTGLGIGGAAPSAVALMSEYSPGRHRALFTNAMVSGIPVGAGLGGFLAAWMIPHWGWRSVLLYGGLVPLAMAIVMFVMLPESVRFMVAAGQSHEKIRAVLRRISVTADRIDSFHLVEPGASETSRGGFSIVFSARYILGSAMLALAYFMGLVIFYAVINWAPTLLRSEGIPPERALLITALFPLGGIGAIFSGWLMDRFNANRIVTLLYVLTAISIYMIGHAVGNVGLLTATVFLAGVFMNTAQVSMPTLAAAFYPTRGRATGVAWMLGFGRLGGVAGSMLVAVLAAHHMGFNPTFEITAVPGLFAAVALLLMRVTQPAAASDASVYNASPTKGGTT